MEWSFFVTEDALKRLQPNVERHEASLLLAFIPTGPPSRLRQLGRISGSEKASMSSRSRTFDAGSSALQLREFLAGSVFPSHPYEREWRGGRGALFLVLFRLRFFLLAIASQLALCHLVLALLAVNA